MIDLPDNWRRYVLPAEEEAAHPRRERRADSSEHPAVAVLCGFVTALWLCVGFAAWLKLGRVLLQHWGLS